MSNALRVGQTFMHWRDIPEHTPPCVYVLVDPREPNRPRYLGSTIQPRERLKKHARRHATNNDMQAWRDAMLADGIAPAMRIVRVCETERECRSAEWKIAARWKRRGVRFYCIHVPPPDDTCLYYATFGWAGALAEVKARRQTA